MFLFDTDHITIIQRQVQPEFGRLAHRVARFPGTAFFYSVVSFHEQTLGANLFVQQARTVADVVRGYDRYSMILAHYAVNQVLPFDLSAGARFDTLRAQKVRIGTMDLRIASIALATNKTVLTRNLRDFRQVPGLNAEDWTV